MTDCGYCSGSSLADLQRAKILTGVLLNQITKNILKYMNRYVVIMEGMMKYLAKEC